MIKPSKDGDTMKLKKEASRFLPLAVATIILLSILLFVKSNNSDFIDQLIQFNGYGTGDFRWSTSESTVLTSLGHMEYDIVQSSTDDSVIIFDHELITPYITFNKRSYSFYEDRLYSTSYYASFYNKEDVIEASKNLKEVIVTKLTPPRIGDIDSLGILPRNGSFIHLYWDGDNGSRLGILVDEIYEAPPYAPKYVIEVITYSP